MIIWRKPTRPLKSITAIRCQLCTLIRRLGVTQLCTLIRRLRVTQPEKWPNLLSRLAKQGGVVAFEPQDHILR